ncbi:MAG TPA: trypsin-like peptidase domain-containing protein [Dehalococcoidia bacterium]|nr:trypsin-like peptidase domain-containing protein [Dehalococcoidia bacterium]
MDPAPSPPAARRSPAAWYLAVVVAAAFAGGAASGAMVSLFFGGEGEDSGPAAPGLVERRVITSEEDAVTQAVEAAGPAVVTVINQKPPRRDEQGRLVESVSVGTGVVVDARGYVVTNEHVIHEPGQLSVVFLNGEERPARLVSDDAPFSDLAVLQIPPGNLKVLPFGDSSRLKLGQTVIAIGSALFELRNSVTTGVVSGLGRRYLREQVFMEDLIQTDAAINAGNSGGPLITTSGEMVGLTTNVVRRVGATENVYGIAFAISSRTMEPIVRSIIERGKYTRPYLGIEHLELDSDVAFDLNLRVDRGALVRRVVEGSPAQAAGIRPGDIILRMGRFELNEDLPFLNALARFNPRDRVALQLLRDGRPLEVTVEVGER